jgi:hypothetical protein
MKKIAAFFTLLMATAIMATAQEDHKSAPKSPRVTAKNDVAEISYGQPSKRGRVIFGDLVPYGQVWRTGANEATELTVKKDVMFGGKPLKKGTYTLFTIPGEKEWTIILNSSSKQWGAYEYEKIKDKNVLEVKANVEKNANVQEEFLINFEGKNLVFKWDEVKVAVSIK